ncbi:AraC family transcriptional regulator [Aestuariirhabdus litorea]|uniref:AraC family transcriptional regulator n=1 Tax=Aestuariirhabdus litorea TaxID=2528527 RepID=A0A3P3VPZ4_9GAMM|nr:AraC family transcriptional regulator [Aestuariirhabdus litorea]RRJ84397.1 AraC family transcriptional regulator [Aestuariirhabdus litorea]RWW97621.1 helix-turn-helix domain-containing protein [Endozoicomonadaceae bacterium GTF-13]
MSQASNRLKVKSSALMGFNPLCRRLQINPVSLLAAEGLSSTVLRSNDLMIDYNSFAHLLNRGADSADFPLFGLALSTYQGLKTFGPLGLLASQAATVADSLEVIKKFFHFHALGVSLTTTLLEREAQLAIEFDLDPSIGLEQVVEVSLGLGYNVLREMAPDTMRGARIHFRHSPLVPPEAYRQYIDAEIRFGQSKDAIVFPPRLLRQPPRPASDALKRYLESFLEQESQGREQPLPHKVSRLIYELIPTGEATLTTIAPMLGLNIRTLQRELKLIGTEFRTLLDQVRFEIARESLAADTPITDIALNLGYSELSAFSRAFKRWSGLSPLQWRQRAQQTGNP